jgi:hypothetical protein
MSYIHLPHQQQDPNAHQSIVYRDNQLWFQRITQIDSTKFQFFNVPLDASNFAGAVRKMLFPNQPSNYAPEDGLSCGTPTIAEQYIIDTSAPRRQDLPDEEVLLNIWIQSDGLEIMIYIGEDDGLNYLMDEAVLQDVNEFITDILEYLKRQMMLLTGNVMATMACVEQAAGMPFQCCGQCESCHSVEQCHHC